MARPNSGSYWAPDAKVITPWFGRHSVVSENDVYLMLWRRGWHKIRQWLCKTNLKRNRPWPTPRCLTVRLQFKMKRTKITVTIGDVFLPKSTFEPSTSKMKVTGATANRFVIRFEVLTKIHTLTFWVMTPCSLAGEYQGIRRTYCPHL
jgi:hypothetical protein